MKAKSKYLDHFNNNQMKPYSNIKERVSKLEGELTDLSQSRNEYKIMEDISEIKSDIRMIKSYLFGDYQTKQSNFRKYSLS